MSLLHKRLDVSSIERSSKIHKARFGNSPSLKNIALMYVLLYQAGRMGKDQLCVFANGLILPPIYWQQQQYQQHTRLDDDMHRALARFRKMIQNSFVVPNYGSARFNFLRIKRWWSRSFYLTEFITSWNCNVGIYRQRFFLSRYSLFCSMIALLNYYACSLNRTASISVQNVCFTTLVGICWWEITYYYDPYHRKSNEILGIPKKPSYKILC